MAVSGSRMRLTVEIFPLLEENSHGPYQAAAVAAFKGRKFALPVQLEDTFEQIWKQIEERYKRNYLTPAQAASFTIKKLQDAYDCDLDLGDTVSAIFEGETDPLKRMIKVVPTFINRDFSVPPTSNLRPANVQKRYRESQDDRASKRRRLEKLQHEFSNQDQPLLSTESEHSSGRDAEMIDTFTAQITARLSRSQSGDSMVIVRKAQTGHEEFAPSMKEESPELGDPTGQIIPETDKETSRSPAPTYKKPHLPASASKIVPHVYQRDRPRKDVSCDRSPKVEIGIEVQEQNDSGEQQDSNVEHRKEDVTVNDGLVPSGAELALSPETSHELIPEGSGSDQSEAAVARRDVYDTPSSPDFAGESAKRLKTLKTYGRFPRTPRLVQRQTSTLNHSRSRSKSSQESGNWSSKSKIGTNGHAHIFRKPKPDEIVSTPQEGLSSPLRIYESNKSHSSPEIREGRLEKPTSKQIEAEKAVETQRNENEKSGHGDVSKVGTGLRLISPAQSSYTMPTVGKNKARITPSPASTAQNARGTLPSAKVARENPFSRKIPRPKSLENSISLEAKSTPKPDVKTEKANGPYKLPKLRDQSESKAARPSVRPGAKSNAKALSRKDSSPSVIIPPREKSISNEFHPDLSPTVPRSSSYRPESFSSKKDTADVASNLLNASRRLAPTREIQSSSFDVDVDQAVQGKLKSSATRKTPIRTELPVPVNVRQLAKHKSIPPRHIIRKSEVPLSENVKHLENAGTASIASTSIPPVPSLTKKSKNETSEPVHLPVVSASSADKPIVISSGDESSLEDSSEDEEQAQKKDEANAVFASPPKAGNSTQTSTNQLEAESASAEEGNVHTTRDAGFIPDAEEPKTSSEDEQSFSEKNPELNTADCSEPPQSPVKSSIVVGTKESIISQAAPWTANSWGFGTQRQPIATQEPEEHIVSRSTSRSRSRERSEAANTTGSESKSVAEPKSRSASDADSTRSSPAIARRPARFLSHSPTPNNSSSEDEPVARSPSPVKVAPQKAMREEDDEADSDSSRSDDSSSSDDGNDMIVEPMEQDQDGDVKIADTNGYSNNGVAAPSRRQITSPPATSQSIRHAASQPLPRKSQVPFPPSKIEVPSTNPATKRQPSQPQTPATVSRRPIFQKFPSITQMLSATLSTPASSETGKIFDAKLLDLSKLAKAKQLGNKAVMFGGNESGSSSEDDSSGDSSSEDEEAGKGPRCSVA